MAYSHQCPNSTESGCRCPQHAIGLKSYSPDPDAYQAALDVAQPTRLRVVTAGPPVDTPACDGRLTCRCPGCEAERARIIKAGPRRVRQPWDVVRRAA